VSIGEDLAQARDQAGLTVAQVSQRTRIRQTIIRGIENDDYSGCGGDFYARGSIRSIAKAVGADPEQLIQQYDAAHRKPAVISATAIDELVTLGRTAGQRKLNWTVVLAGGLALVLALGLVGYHLASGAGPPAGSAPGAARVAASGHASHGVAASPGAARAAAPASRAATAPAAPPAVPVAALAPASATAFGLPGPGQGDNPQTAAAAIDGSRATAWRTDWYTTALFGNLYPGTGLLLDMGHPVTVTAARITLGRAHGADLQLRVGGTPALADMAPAARADGAGGVVRLRLASPAHGRYVLLWFTRLPPDPDGTFQVSVYDISLQGQA
jgi:transcriptional regulator with XRE-family HTH domain